jgi:hypothetical protein
LLDWVSGYISLGLEDVGIFVHKVDDYCKMHKTYLYDFYTLVTLIHVLIEDPSRHSSTDVIAASFESATVEVGWLVIFSFVDNFHMRRKNTQIEAPIYINPVNN